MFNYNKAFHIKIKEALIEFKKYNIILPDYVSFDSKINYRKKVEYAVNIKNNKLSYIMFDTNNKCKYEIIKHGIVLETIQRAMVLLKKLIEQYYDLQCNLFQINFFANLNNQVIATLIYRKEPINAYKYKEVIKEFKANTNIIITFRWNKGILSLQRRVLEQVYNLPVGKLRYLEHIDLFSQPNPYINKEMLTWLVQNGLNKQIGGNNLLELYCGSGNFTLALAYFFKNVFATESVRLAIKTLECNINLNGIINVLYARMKADEIEAALFNIRDFKRLKIKRIDISNFIREKFTILVDPPRVGLKKVLNKIITKANKLIYISCNYKSCIQDIIELQNYANLEIQELAFFNQFPKTEHLELGMIINIT